MSVFKPGNYSVKFREFASKALKSPFLSERDRAGLRMVVQSLQSAIHFGLPDCGVILPRAVGKPMPDIRDIIRPPYPVTVLEYSALHGAEVEGMDSPSSRRIVLAVEAKYTGAAATMLIPIVYRDGHKDWMMPLLGWAINQDPFAAGEFSADKGLAVHPHPLMPDLLEKNRELVTSHPLFPAGSTYEQAMLKDAADEISAYADFVQALACSNVGTETIPAARALNRCRVQSGKPKLFDYKVLTLGNVGERGDGHGEGGSDRRSPRSHLRRGHIRNLQSGKRTWVNAAFIRGSGDGFVHKDYRVEAAG